MKKLQLNFRHWPLIVVPLILSYVLFEKKRITVYLIGDSTMAYYRSPAFPIEGWGMPFANFFNSSVTIKNKAEGGESTRTFIEEKLWKHVADSLKAGDYLLIQFGHNDEVPSKESYTTEKDYKANLIRFVTEARKKRANPVLISPVARRKFDSSGKIVDMHRVYSAILQNVALEYKVPFIDLNKKSLQLFQELGPEKSKSLFLARGENPYYPKDEEDITHFNAIGARKIAEIVLEELKGLKVEWSKEMRNKE
jgi:lysophospholipase L1-like esterase